MVSKAFLLGWHNDNNKISDRVATTHFWPELCKTSSSNSKCWLALEILEQLPAVARTTQNRFQVTLQVTLAKGG